MKTELKRVQPASCHFYGAGIDGLDGITVQADSGAESAQRTVRYKGEVCPMIGRTERLCEQDTSYFGCVLNSSEIYQTPIGLIKRSYSATGAGLERKRVKWLVVI
jgi:hypothetical protein